MKRLEVNCTSTEQIHFERLKLIQGELKDLEAVNYHKYKQSLLKHGIMKPVNVWVNENDEYCVLDGTQLCRTLVALEREGYDIPQIPITKVEAKNFRDAKQKILVLASQFGTFNGQGFLEFSQDLELSEINFPSIDMDKLAEEFTKDSTDKKPKKEKKCPHCGEDL